MARINSPKTGYICRECRKMKLLRYILSKSQFCLWCMKNTNTDINISLHANTSVKTNLRLRCKRKGFKKFISEFLEGWFPSGDRKLKDGVHKTRSVDKEKDTYDEVIKEAKAGKVIHKCHEKLSDHIGHGDAKK